MRLHPYDVAHDCPAHEEQQGEHNDPRAVEYVVQPSFAPRKKQHDYQRKGDHKRRVIVPCKRNIPVKQRVKRPLGAASRAFKSCEHQPRAARKPSRIGGVKQPVNNNHRHRNQNDCDDSDSVSY